MLTDLFDKNGREIKLGDTLKIIAGFEPEDVVIAKVIFKGGCYRYFIDPPEFGLFSDEVNFYREKATLLNTPSEALEVINTPPSC